MSLAVGIDIGGHQVRAALVDAHGQVRGSTRRPSTPGDPDALVATIVAAARDFIGPDVVGVGVSAAAFVDAARRTVLFAPNLAWRDLPLPARVADALGLPVVLENDGNAAAWGEYVHGAGADARTLLAVTVGTGVGGGIVTEGRLLRGGFGVGGEIGHVRIDPSGPLCGCGNRGCLEAVASGPALVRRAQELAPAGLVQRAGGVDRITGHLVTAAAQDGDADARELLARHGALLGEGIAVIAAVVDPDVVVLGGGVSAAGELVLDPLRASYEQHLAGRGTRPVARIEAAELGDDAGVVGAADLTRREVAS